MGKARLSLQKGGQGLSVGAIIGIVIAVLAILAAIIVPIYFFVIKDKINAIPEIPSIRDPNTRKNIDQAIKELQKQLDDNRGTLTTDKVDEIENEITFLRNLLKNLQGESFKVNESFADETELYTNLKLISDELSDKCRADILTDAHKDKLNEENLLKLVGQTCFDEVKVIVSKLDTAVQTLSDIKLTKAIRFSEEMSPQGTTLGVIGPLLFLEPDVISNYLDEYYDRLTDINKPLGGNETSEYKLVTLLLRNIIRQITFWGQHKKRKINFSQEDPTDDIFKFILYDTVDPDEISKLQLKYTDKYNALQKVYIEDHVDISVDNLFTNEKTINQLKKIKSKIFEFKRAQIQQFNNTQKEIVEENADKPAFSPGMISFFFYFMLYVPNVNFTEHPFKESPMDKYTLETYIKYYLSTPYEDKDNKIDKNCLYSILKIFDKAEDLNKTAGKNGYTPAFRKDIEDKYNVEQIGKKYFDDPNSDLMKNCRRLFGSDQDCLCYDIIEQYEKLNNQPNHKEKVNFIIDNFKCIRICYPQLGNSFIKKQTSYFNTKVVAFFNDSKAQPQAKSDTKEMINAVLNYNIEYDDSSKLRFFLSSLKEVSTPEDDTGDYTGDDTGDYTGDDTGDYTGDDTGDDTGFSYRQKSEVLDLILWVSMSTRKYITDLGIVL